MLRAIQSDAFFMLLVGDRLGLKLIVLVFLGMGLYSYVKEEIEKKRNRRHVRTLKDGREFLLWPFDENDVPRDLGICESSLKVYADYSCQVYDELKNTYGIKKQGEAFKRLCEILHDRGELVNCLNMRLCKRILSSDIKNYKNIEKELLQYRYDFLKNYDVDGSAYDMLSVIAFVDLDIEAVLEWSRKKVGAKSTVKVAAEGLAMTRYFLLLKEFLDERKEDEPLMGFLKRMYDTYYQEEWWILYCYCMAVSNKNPSNEDEMDFRRYWEKGLKSGHYLAFSWEVLRDVCKEIPAWHDGYNISLVVYPGGQLLRRCWKDICQMFAEQLAQEVKHLPEGWYEREQLNAVKRAKRIKNHIGGGGYGEYQLGLSYYALRDNKNAIAHMEEAVQAGNNEAKVWLTAHNVKTYGFYFKEREEEKYGSFVAYSDNLNKKPHLQGYVSIADYISDELKAKLHKVIREFVEREIKSDSIDPKKYLRLIKSTSDEDVQDILRSAIYQMGTDDAVYAWIISMKEKEQEELLASWYGTTGEDNESREKRRRALMVKAVINRDVILALGFTGMNFEPIRERYGGNKADWEKTCSNALGGNMKALYEVGSRYYYFAYNTKKDGVYREIGNIILDYIVAECKRRWEEDHYDEEALILWTNVEGGIRLKHDVRANIYREGLFYKLPYFCGTAYLVKEELELTDSEIREYMAYASAHGYDTNGMQELIKDDHECEQREMDMQRKKIEAAKAWKESSKRHELENRMTLLEMQIDRMNGGSGRSVEEKAITGDVSLDDYMTYQMMKGKKINELSKK